MAQPDSTPDLGTLPRSVNSIEQVCLIGTLARGLVDTAAPRRRPGPAGGPLLLQMGDRRTDRRRQRPGCVVELAAMADRFAPDHDPELWRASGVDGGADPVARRNFR